MKTIIRHISLAFCAMVLLFSCGPERIVPDRQDAMVMIKAPASYNFALGQTKSFVTKAEGESDGFDNLFIRSDRSLDRMRNMSKGSTLWLFIEVPEDGYQYRETYNSPQEVVEPARWVESSYSYKPYIVGENGAMYPCETEEYTVIENGVECVYRKVRTDALTGEPLSSGSALLLPSGLYKFHAVSPATPLLVKEGSQVHAPTVHVKNGDYVLATDVRWKQTYPKGVLIRGGTDVSGVQHISLAALVNQTARIKVNIRCGDDHVRMLAVQKNGIEINGIQENIHGKFAWTMDADTIKTRIGNKYEGLMFHEYEAGKDTDGRDMITAYASILPTDARTSTVYLLFHLIVNNVPTQYMVGLTNQLYKAANQYEFNFKVRMDGNVTVGTWDNGRLIYDDIELE